jgi:hypothetical protein
MSRNRASLCILSYFLLLPLVSVSSRSLSTVNVPEAAHIETPDSVPAGFNTGLIRRMNHPEIEPLEDSPPVTPHIPSTQPNFSLSRSSTSNSLDDGSHRSLQGSEISPPQPTTKPRIPSICAAYKRLSNNLQEKYLTRLTAQERNSFHMTCCKFGLAWCLLPAGIAVTVSDGPPKIGLGLLGAGAALGLSGVKDMWRNRELPRPARRPSTLLVPQRTPVKRRRNVESRKFGHQELGKGFK